jgi:zinc transporter ZupT
MMAFSGGFLLAVCVGHLFPEAYLHLTASQAGIFVLLGFALQIVIDMYSEGIEHGHMHSTESELCEDHHHNHTPVSKLALSLLASLSVHSLLEGIPLNGPFSLRMPLGQNAVFWGVVLHKAPAAFALATILKTQHASPRLIWTLTALYALVTPLGVLFGNLLLAQQGNNIDYLFPFISAVVAGSFFQISTTVLLESSNDHRPKPVTLLFGGLGCLVAFLTL